MSKGKTHTELDPIRCRCGAKWGQHCLEFEIDMKPNCVICGDHIKTQCEELYCMKGNYCCTCNNKCALKPEEYKQKYYKQYEKRS